MKIYGFGGEGIQANIQGPGHSQDDFIMPALAIADSALCC